MSNQFILELTLSPSNGFYQLDSIQRIPWTTCELRINPNEKLTMIKYAELNEIFIKHASKKKQNYSPDELYTLTFLVSFRVSCRKEH